ncbi:MAG TPA: iron ABC transporter permease [Caldilineae bacterium]|nr:iron ABC transporter permease [Caldilineae bacterium]
MSTKRLSALLPSPGLLALALIPLGFLTLFYFYPLFEIFKLSLFPGGRFAADGLRPLLEKTYYLRVLWFTIWQATVSTLGALALGLPAAYIFARYRFPGKSLFRALTTLPFVMPTVVVATAFTALLGPRGVLNEALMQAFGLDAPPIALQGTIWIILLAHIFYNTSVIIRMVGGFWANLDPRLGAAAATLGAGPWARFRHITAPLLLPAIIAASLLVFLFNFTSFGVILILGGPGFATLEVEIYRSAVRLFNLPVAAVLALVQMAFTLTLMAIYTRLQARLTTRLDFRPGEHTQKWPRTLGERIYVYGVLAILGVFLLSPLAALVWRSFSLGGEFGIQHYQNLFVNRTGSIFFVTPIEAVRNSLGFAAVTVLFSLLIGVSSAYLLAGNDRRKRGCLSSILDPIFMLPLGTSAVTLGFGYIVALDEPPLNLRTSLLIIPIAHTLIAFPFVLRALLPILRGMNPNLREAASSLGASPRRVLRHVDLPILARALVVGVIFAFTISMGEFGATLLISRPQFPTLPVAIYRFLGQPGLSNYGQALALSVILLLTTAVGFLAIENLRYGDIGEF